MSWRTTAARLGKSAVVIGSAVDRVLTTGPRANRSPEGVDEGAAYQHLWTDAATTLGATVEAVGPFLRVQRDNHTAWLWRQETDLDGVTTLRLAADKPTVHALLRQAHLTVPAHEVFDAAAPEAGRQFLGQHRRCVVKPAAGTARGAGVTTGVTTAADFDKAVLAAARWDRSVLIEEQLDGDVHRLLLLDGKLLDTVVRRSPHLIGDGRGTVRALAQGNGLTVDLDMVLALRSQGLSLKDVPATGRIFKAKGVVNENRDEENERPARVPEAMAALAQTAAAAIGLRLAGVDMMGETVLEVNGTPGLLLHERAQGQSPPTPPAHAVLKALLR